MNIDFIYILTSLTVASGIIVLYDKFLWQRHYSANSLAINPESKPFIIKHMSSFFKTLLVVLFIRSFIAQGFTVPTPSLSPTVMPVEMLLISQSSYGIKLPVIGTKLFETGTPKRGDIIVFKWPVDHKHFFVKRLIGLPGDKISYINKVLYINGKKAEQKFVGTTTDTDNGHESWKATIITENLNGVKHSIYVCANNEINCPNSSQENFYDLIVPKKKYFFMGDNRDNSDDSRGWGFVNEKDLVGKATYTYFSYNPFTYKVRWNRIGVLQ